MTAIESVGRSRWQEIAERERPRLREIVQSEILPLVDDAEATEVFPVEVLRVLGREGFLSIGAPLAEGGMGGGRTAEVMVVEELTRASAGITMSVVPFFIVRIAIWEFATERAREEVGIPMINGTRVVGICMSEPDAGSDVASISTRAVPVEGGWEISGSKMFITNASIADDLLVAAKVKREDGRDGIGLFLLDTDQTGFEARKLNKEAARASDTTEVRMERCFVPDYRVVGPPAEGFKHAMRVLNGERILSAARAVQLARDVWDDTVAWASETTLNGEPRIALQAYQGPLAAAMGELWLLRLAVDRACAMWDDGDSGIKEISMLKTLSSKKSVELTRTLQSLRGLDAHVIGNRTARNVRDARLGTVTAGTEQIMHRVLARQADWPAARH